MNPANISCISCQFFEHGGTDGAVATSVWTLALAVYCVDITFIHTGNLQ